MGAHIVLPSPFVLLYPTCISARKMMSAPRKSINILIQFLKRFQIQQEILSPPTVILTNSIFLKYSGDLKTRLFKIWTILFGFQMVCDKMVAICPDFTTFQISFKIQTICNPTSFWTFKIQTRSLSYRRKQFQIKLHMKQARREHGGESVKF